MGESVSHPRRRRILLAEDDADLREALADALRGGGHHVTAVENGREALRRMREEHPDVLVLDLMMPVLDGWQVRVEQRRDPSIASTPVVAISASRSAAANAVDADLYLQKPFDPVALARTIDEVLAARARRDQPARDAIQLRLEALRDVAAGVVHELNNPLTYLMLHLRRSIEVLERVEQRRDRRAIAEALTHLYGATHGAERVAALAARVRTVARIDDVGEAALDLEPVVEAALALLPEIGRHARVERSFDGAPPVLANEAALVQMLTNLLRNAMQSIPAGHPDDHTIRVVVHTDEKGCAVIGISDSGGGIPTHLRSRVFEPFFSTRPADEASGLGLSISLLIVQSLGGRLELESEPGQGTSVTVCLPAARQRLAERRREPSRDDTR